MAELPKSLRVIKSALLECRQILRAATHVQTAGWDFQGFDPPEEDLGVGPAWTGDPGTFPTLSVIEQALKEVQRIQETGQF